MSEERNKPEKPTQGGRYAKRMRKKYYFFKAGLEGLAGQIPGLTEIHVYTKALPSSANADLMLDTTFVDEAALKGYAVHPAHVAVADGKVRPYTAVRTCLDFEV